MKVTFVRYYNPKEVMEVTPDTSDEQIIEACFRVNVYDNYTDALMAYAETPGTEWSTLLEGEDRAQSFIKEAWSHIKSHDIDWLEQHFV